MKYTSLIGVLLITTNLVCESLLSHVIDERYNVRVSTRHYKGPELLTNDMVVIVIGIRLLVRYLVSILYASRYCI